MFRPTRSLDDENECHMWRPCPYGSTSVSDLAPANKPSVGFSSNLSSRPDLQKIYEYFLLTDVNEFISALEILCCPSWVPSVSEQSHRSWNLHIILYRTIHKSVKHFKTHNKYNTQRIMVVLTLIDREILQVSFTYFTDAQCVHIW